MTGRLAAACLAGALLASCGGGDEEEASRGAAESRYAERANAICDELSMQTRRLADRTFGDLGRRPSRALRRRYERRAAALRREALAQVRALEAPRGEEGAVAAFEDSFARASGALAARPALRPGRPGAPALERFEDRARALGLEKCAGES